MSPEDAAPHRHGRWGRPGPSSVIAAHTAWPKTHGPSRCRPRCRRSWRRGSTRCCPGTSGCFRRLRSSARTCRPRSSTRSPSCPTKCYAQVVDVDLDIGVGREVVGEAARHRHRREARVHVERPVAAACVVGVSRDFGEGVTRPRSVVDEDERAMPVRDLEQRTRGSGTRCPAAGCRVAWRAPTSSVASWGFRSPACAPPIRGSGSRAVRRNSTP